MPTTSPLKRPSAGGRLGRLLASLRPPKRAGPLPVQTGFPTSLADLVVKNHSRLKHPSRRRHRAPTPPPAPAPLPVAAAQPSPPSPVPEQGQEQTREAVTVRIQSAAVVVVGHRKGAAFRIRPEVLAVGGAVALALLVVWSKWLVAAATAASVALVWIESSASRRRPPLDNTTTREGLVLCGRGVVSPIREETETPRSSCADSDTGSDVSSVWAAADTTDDLAGGEGEDSNLMTTAKRKEKRRSLRKLIAKKLRKNGKRSAKEEDMGTDNTGSVHAGEAGVNAGPVVTETEPALPAPAVQYATTAPEAITAERCRQLQGGALFVPIILAGLVVGKLPAVALTVLCAVFFSSVDRVPSC